MNDFQSSDIPIIGDELSDVKSSTKQILGQVSKAVPLAVAGAGVAAGAGSILKKNVTTFSEEAEEVGEGVYSGVSKVKTILKNQLAKHTNLEVGFEPVEEGAGLLASAGLPELAGVAGLALGASFLVDKLINPSTNAGTTKGFKPNLESKVGVQRGFSKTAPRN